MKIHDSTTSRRLLTASTLGAVPFIHPLHLRGIADRTAPDVTWDPVKRELAGNAVDAKELTRGSRDALRL